MSDFAHLCSDCIPTLALTTEERLESLKKPLWIGYGRANEIMEELKSLLSYPKQPRMPNKLIVGDSNNGKTTLIERFTKKFGEPYVDAEGNAVRPVVLTEAPTTPDEKGLYYSILNRFWDIRGSNKTVADLRYQVLHLMRSCQVKLLIIDEMHSLLTGSPMKQREVMNALKFMCNELRIPIVGVGCREAVQVLHTDPQHASRFDVLALPAWKMGKEFRRLLVSFESELPLRKPSNLHDEAIAGHLHWICEGNLGNLSRLLTQCAREAILTGSERIDESIIKRHEWFRPTRGIREQPA